MPGFSVSFSIPPVRIWLGSCNTNHITNPGGSRSQSTHSPQKWQTGLLGYCGDAPAVLPLVPDTGVEGQTVIAGGGGAGGIRFQHLLDADHLIGAGPQLGGVTVSPGSSVWRSPKSSLTPRLCPAMHTLPAQMLVSRKWPAPFARTELPVPWYTLVDRPMAGIFKVPRYPPE